jgi:zinc protease
MMTDSASGTKIGAALALAGATVVFTTLALADDEPNLRPAPHDDYAVIVSAVTAESDGWKQVVSALRTFHRDHGVRTYVWNDSPLELVPVLSEENPRYVAFVAPPSELGRSFFLDVHRLVRGLDEDPWPDVEWGIVTGRTWEPAMRQVVTREPLVIRRAAAGTGLPLASFEEAIWWDEGVPGRSVRKNADGTVVESRGTANDTMPGIVSSLNEFKPDFFFSSGRATQDDWRVGYAFKGGAFKVEDGALVGVAPDGSEHPVASDNPKVWLAAGNCLLGDVRNEDSMALAIIDSAGATQFAGYGGVTWHGRAGWGTADWFLTDPGRWNLSEAFFLNQAQLIHELALIDPALASLDLGDFGPREDEVFREALKKALGGSLDEETFERALGHLWDRDVMIFYGDPAWDARLHRAENPAWHSSVFEDTDGHWHVRFEAARDVQLSRPPAVILPHRLKVNAVLEGGQEAIVNDMFVMLPAVDAFSAGDVREIIIDADALEMRDSTVIERTPRQVEEQMQRLPERYRGPVRAQLERAGSNRGELVAAIESCDSPQSLRAIGFLLAYMPQRDLRSLDASFIMAHLSEALLVREESPFCRDLPEEVFLNEVLPYAFVGEHREEWRAPLRERFMGIVSDAPSQEAAVKLLNEHLWREYGIVYHATKRPKTDQSPSETIDCGVASCTGLSIILADACRAVGIPVRLAGVPMWHNDTGNHTWIEVWEDGAWHFVEAYGSDGYDRAWWAPHAEKADASRPRYAVWATSYRPSGEHFPVEWAPGDETIPAINVTERYVPETESK